MNARITCLFFWPPQRARGLALIYAARDRTWQTKEDIEKLTQIVEGVRTQYAKELENLSQETASSLN